MGQKISAIPPPPPTRYPFQPMIGCAQPTYVPNQYGVYSGAGAGGSGQYAGSPGQYAGGPAKFEGFNQFGTQAKGVYVTSMPTYTHSPYHSWTPGSTSIRTR